MEGQEELRNRRKAFNKYMKYYDKISATVERKNMGLKAWEG